MVAPKRPGRHNAGQRYCQPSRTCLCRRWFPFWGLKKEHWNASIEDPQNPGQTYSIANPLTNNMKMHPWAYLRLSWDLALVQASIPRLDIFDLQRPQTVTLHVERLESLIGNECVSAEEEEEENSHCPSAGISIRDSPIYSENMIISHPHPGHRFVAQLLNLTGQICMRSRLRGDICITDSDQIRSRVETEIIRTCLNYWWTRFCYSCIRWGSRFLG